MNEVTLPASMEMLRQHKPGRVVKELDNGNLAILQIVDPKAVPRYVKWLRTKKGRIVRVMTALEAAIRVGRIVFTNAMRKSQDD